MIDFIEKNILYIEILYIYGDDLENLFSRCFIQSQYINCKK